MQERQPAQVSPGDLQGKKVARCGAQQLLLLIVAFTKSKQSHLVLEVFEAMRQQVVPDPITYNILTRACETEPKQLLEVFKAMQQQGVQIVGCFA